MDFRIDFILRTGASYDDLVVLIQGNPRYVLDKIDKRTKKAKNTGGVEVVRFE